MGLDISDGYRSQGVDSVLRYQRAKGTGKTPWMSKYLETEMREGVDVSIK